MIVLSFFHLGRFPRRGIVLIIIFWGSDSRVFIISCDSDLTGLIPIDRDGLRSFFGQSLQQNIRIELPLLNFLDLLQHIMLLFLYLFLH